MVVVIMLLCSISTAAGGQSVDALYEVLVKWAPGRGKIGSGGNLVSQLPGHFEWIDEHPVVKNTRAGFNGAAKSMAKFHEVIGWSLLRYAADVHPEIVADEIEAHPLVECAQPNYVRRFASRTNDPLLVDQENLEAIGWEMLPDIGRPVVVAIIDSGADLGHPDLAQQLWKNEIEIAGVSGVDDDENGYVDDIVGWDFSDAPGLPGEGDYLQRDANPSDESGHGTHVAGIVAATADNGIGVAGVASAARLMILRAGFNVAGVGFLQDDDIAGAVVYAVDNGADILNMSFGDPVHSTLIEDVIRFATSSGCLVVAAVGNEGDNEVFYPARLKDVVGVAAVDNTGMPMSFSNWGYSVDVAGPGNAIHGLLPGGNYVKRSGTSMATAHVSGIAAVVWARQPQLAAGQVRGAIANSALDVFKAGWDQRTGAGLVQFDAHRVGNPTAVSIRDPAIDVATGDSVRVRGSVWSNGDADYTLHRSNKPNSEVMELLLSGQVKKPEIELDFMMSTSDLVQGSYLLQLQAEDRMRRSHLQRILLEVYRSPATLSDLRLARVLNGDVWADVLRWKASSRSFTTIMLVNANADTVLRIPLWSKPSNQSVILPDDIQRGDYNALFVGDQALGGSERLAITLNDVGIDRWPMKHKSSLPSGYLLPMTTDFDFDGVPEIVAMKYSGPGYNPTNFYLPGETPIVVHTSSRPFIPWNTHDLDNDGRTEIMAIDTERMRLIEATSSGFFPTKVTFEASGVWGGEVIDSDGDGFQEMFLRSSRAEQFRVFEARGDDQFVQVGTLINPSEGLDGLGERQVVADFDGDGWGELLSGDEDGDVFIYESIADDTWRNNWMFRNENGDSRVVGGGFDTDGDNRLEFLVAGLQVNEFDLSRTQWTVTLFEAVEDNRYSEQWSAEIIGGASGANGIAAGDFDGDGTPEIAVALVPNLYLFRCGQSVDSEPVWHTHVADPNRPLVADVDADGVVDLVTNSGNSLDLFSLPINDQTEQRLDAPANFFAHANSELENVLGWTAVPGAGAYRLFRAERREEFAILVDTLSGIRFEDRDVTSGKKYWYAVAALDSISKKPGYLSKSVMAIPELRPKIVSVRRIARDQFYVEFDNAMGKEIHEHFRYYVPSLGIPRSAAVFAGGRRALLTFDYLPESGDFVLTTQGLRNERGTPLENSDFSFLLSPVVDPIRLLSVELKNSTCIVLRFSEPVVLDAENRLLGEDANRHFIISSGAVEIDSVMFEEDYVTLLLSKRTPIRPTGRKYEINLVELVDYSGREIQGSTFVEMSPDVLRELIIFPNPFDPNEGEVTVSGLPQGSTVDIATVAGDLVWWGSERDGDGGIQWDGRNKNGKLAAGGIYFVRAYHEGNTQLSKLALLRDK